MDLPGITLPNPHRDLLATLLHPVLRRHHHLKDLQALVLHQPTTLPHPPRDLLATPPHPQQRPQLVTLHHPLPSLLPAHQAPQPLGLLPATALPQDLTPLVDTVPHQPTVAHPPLQAQVAQAVLELLPDTLLPASQLLPHHTEVITVGEY